VLRKQYLASSPYPHVVVSNVADDARLRLVRDEIIENIRATFKETDIYKMFQTGDLNNLDKLEPEEKAQLQVRRRETRTRSDVQKKKEKRVYNYYVYRFTPYRHLAGTGCAAQIPLHTRDAQVGE